ncbi:MAG: Mannosyltransferase OCH1 and related enzymes [uncultured Sulfurovum sp.]|uniref:Mannosyltransferase OCH1 and related enzymes n=1 Tax=uncultured Sulfurovum sp. TaxID=269237 RepID=A0A6S6SEU3_9BACT|nr:MAG: Mannosyltransferase OCH1 and related enzymes [uncultured Sulfurovum sp.]
MSFKIVLANRSIKILGAMVKGVSYLFHTIFPQKRFIIPKYTKALRPSKEKTGIPKIIWQTNFSSSVTLPVYANYLFNRYLSPDYEHRYVSTEARYTFLEDHAPKEVFEAYAQLTDGAAQADLWRMFTLNFYGGVYMDIDAHAVWPLSKMIQADDKEIFLLNKQHYTNYFIASEKENPILQKTIDIIVDNIQKKKIEGGVYDLTGPNTLNLAIGTQTVNHRFYRHTCVQGSFTNEYFQYLDKPKGKWTHAKNETLLKSDTTQKNKHINGELN